MHVDLAGVREGVLVVQRLHSHPVSTHLKIIKEKGKEKGGERGRERGKERGRRKRRERGGEGEGFLVVRCLEADFQREKRGKER